MPSRTDKLDAMILAASVTGFNFDVLEGVQGDTVSEKALSGVSVLIPSTEDYNADNRSRNGRADLVSKGLWAAGADTWILPKSASTSLPFLKPQTNYVSRLQDCQQKVVISHYYRR